MFLATGLAYTVYSVWRPKSWRPVFAAAPALIFVALEIAFGGWSDKPLWFAAVALGGIFYLQRVRTQLSVLLD